MTHHSTSHLAPNNHLRWSVTQDKELHVDLFDDNILTAVLKRWAGADASQRRWNWSFLRAQEMLSDIAHVRRTSAFEAKLYEEDVARVLQEANEAETGGKPSLPASVATAPAGIASGKNGAKSPAAADAYWADLKYWEQQVAETPSSWNLLHLATTLGGLGRATVRTARSPQGEQMGFFQIVDGASAVLKREKAELDAEMAPAEKGKQRSKQQEKMTRERILRATEAKILAAKCLATPKRLHEAVEEEFCAESQKLDAQAAREAAYIFLSRGFEANSRWQEREERRDGEVRFFGFFDEIIAPIILLPCSTCLSPCDYSPHTRLPTGQIVSVGEMRRKLDLLSPGFCDVLEQYGEKAECSSVKESGANAALASKQAECVH